MCFLIDEENNKAQGTYLAHPDLLKLIDAVAESDEAKVRGSHVAHNNLLKVPIIFRENISYTPNPTRRYAARLARCN